MSSEPTASGSSGSDQGRQAAINLVLTYLKLMEARSIAAAQACLAEGAALVFPGGRIRRSVAEIAAGSSGRYRSIGKAIEACESFESGPALHTVYVLGTLYGEWPDGTPFEGIRFIDRFVVGCDGIREQSVWNDSGEARIARDLVEQTSCGETRAGA